MTVYLADTVRPSSPVRAKLDRRADEHRRRARPSRFRGESEPIFFGRELDRNEKLCFVRFVVNYWRINWPTLKV
jgi:hypothetical protein